MGLCSPLARCFRFLLGGQVNNGNFANKRKKMKEVILAWLMEKTTWLGIFASAAAFGFELTEPQQTALSTLAASLFIMGDRK